MLRHFSPASYGIVCQALTTSPAIPVERGKRRAKELETIAFHNFCVASPESRPIRVLCFPRTVLVPPYERSRSSGSCARSERKQEQRRRSGSKAPSDRQQPHKCKRTVSDIFTMIINNHNSFRSLAAANPLRDCDKDALLH